MIPQEILNYVLIREIGAGGMGQVFLARNRDIDQYVAIKVLHPRFANNQALRQRFKQEAMLLSSLNHPNIVKFLNYVENEHGVFLIMEYVEGMTLEDFIRNKNGLIVEKRAYPMMNEILDAFHYAHQHGIVHRDIKPSNIFLNNEGHIKIMDFGIAQILSDVNGQSYGGREGTPEYMSPEQVKGSPVDKRSDIYSLGVLFHHMLTGRTPYNATTLSRLEIMQCVVDKPLPRLKEFYPYTSDGMQRIVDKAVCKNPDDRYQDCAEMKKAVKKVLEPEKRSRLPLYAAIAAGVLVLGALFFIWDYNRTKVSYYKDYAEFYGVPKGIGSLSSREMRHRPQSYRAEYRKGKLRRLTLVNSKGKPIGYSDTEFMNLRNPDVEYFYNDAGKIDYKKIYDQYGKLLYKLDYDENLKTASLKYDDEYGTVARLRSNTTSNYITDDMSVERSQISRYLLDFDPETGLLRSLKYASGENNDCVGDADNIFGFSYEYDDKGRISTINFLGQDGKVRGNKFGLATKRYTYDDDDNWKTVEYFSADGSPSHDGNNCTVVTLDYDKWGNRISEKYTSADGEPAFRTDMGAFGFAYEIDDQGNRVKQVCIDGNGEPMICNYGFSTIVTDYNDDGFPIKNSYYDLSGQPTNMIEHGEAYAVITFDVNERGQQTDVSFYNRDGNPTLLTSGYHRRSMEYDSLGNVLKTVFYDIDGNQAKISGYFSAITTTYDEFNRPTSESYLDEKGALTNCPNGFSVIETEYDRKGNVAKYTTFDKEGKKVKNLSGFAVKSFRYDDIGNNTIVELFDENDKPCVDHNGYHKVENVYEPKTNFLIEERYYGLDRLIETNHHDYDDNGNVIKAYVTRPDGSLKSGTVVDNSEYDINNRVIRSWSSDLKGNLVNEPGRNYSQARFTYDKHGNPIETVFLDRNGKPSADTDGTYKRLREYDAANRIVYEKNVDPNDKPIKGKSGSPEGRLVYDERGNVLELIAYDGYGKDALSADGFHKLVRTYDSRNNVLTLEYLDTANKLIVPKSAGFAKMENVYDEKGNVVNTKYYNASNKLIEEAKSTYNAHDQLTSTVYVNASGQQVDGQRGFSKFVIEYQSNGITPTQRKVYKSSGELLATSKYNTRTSDWGDYVMKSSAHAIQGFNNWRDYYIELAMQCPYTDPDTGITITKITPGASNVEIYMRLNYDRSALGDLSELKKKMSQLQQLLRSNTKMPSDIGLDIYVYDKNNSYLFLI